MAGVAEAEKGIFSLLQNADVENVTAPGQPYAPSANYTPIRGQPDDTGKNLQKDIKTLIGNSRVNLNEETSQLINEIERRALAEI